MGQSASTATLAGQASDPSGRGLAQALVTLSSSRGGGYTETTTDVSGSFRLPLLAPGSYELRIEALGYRPLLVRGVTLVAGETRRLTLSLSPAPPPVLYVDTILASPTQASRPRIGGGYFGERAIESWPNRRDDLSSVVRLSSVFDETLGGQGLPGSMTVLVADGLPFYRAPVPAGRSELIPTPLFGRGSISGVTVLPNVTDIEWSGAGSGSYIGVSAVPGSFDSDAEVEGSYSPAPLWMTDEFEAGTQSPSSYSARGRGVLDLAEEQVQVSAAGEVVQSETPLVAQVTPALEAELPGLDPGLLTALTRPGLERYSRYGGLVRLDATSGLNSRLFVRAAAARTERRFDGESPVSTPTGAPREESTDFSVAAGLTLQQSASLTYDLKAGLSGSYRDFGLPDGSLTPASVTDIAARLGTSPSAAGESSRTDFVMLPTLQFTPGWDPSGTIKAGTWLRASRHTMTHSRAAYGDLVFGDGTSFDGTGGYGIVTSIPEASFGTQEYGLFAQWEGFATPALRFRFGARYDYERIGGTQPVPDTDWLTVSGLRNEDYPSHFNQLGIRGALTWEPTPDSGTRFDIQASMHHGDVETPAIYQVLGGSLGGTVSRFRGIAWPSPDIPPSGAVSLPTLSLFGPDTRAPRSTSVSGAISQRLGDALTLHVVGTLRRTDYLMRRRNLNLPLTPVARDPNGGGIYGELVQDGATVTAVGSDNRRFGGFGEVWALDPDGWSDFRGLTGGIEHSTPGLQVHAAYTFSRTTDNWVGAAAESVEGTLRPTVPSAQEAWSEARSDYDVPHRAVFGATVSLGELAISGVYRVQSGRAFTPGYRVGVDANGDGSFRNDVAFVPDAANLGALGSRACLAAQAGALAGRNSCRGPLRQSLDARIQVTTRRFGSVAVGIFVDALDILETDDGIIDEALLLVDPTGTIQTSPDGETITIPLMLNEGFGDVVYPWSRGRMLRFGVRIGG